MQGGLDCMRKQSPNHLLLYLGYGLIGFFGFLVLVGIINFLLSSAR